MSASPQTHVIEARGLVKRYGNAIAVDGIDLAVEKGEVFGLLGPNGSGKTTTILMMLGLTEPSAGEMRVLGLDPLRQPLAVKRRVGYLPDQIGFYDHLTARENLGFSARLTGLASAEAGRRIDEALARVRLSEVGNRRVSTFSRGMRQRLGLAEVLVKDAEIAILDEPTSGLDPQSTQELLDLIRATPGARIISTSSSMQGSGDLKLDRVATDLTVSGPKAYGTSKLANILFTKELQRRLGPSVAVNCFHPGIVKSKFGAFGEDFGFLINLAYKLSQPFAKTPEQGADTLVWLATAPEAAGLRGEYLAHRKLIKPQKQALDADLARGLWTLSERLCAAALVAR